MCFKSLQGWWFHHCPWQPFPGLGSPVSEEISPDIQSQPLLVQFEADFQGRLKRDGNLVSLQFRLSELTLAVFGLQSISRHDLHLGIPPGKHFGQVSPALDDEIKSMEAGHTMPVSCRASKERRIPLTYFTVIYQTLVAMDKEI